MAGNIIDHSRDPRRRRNLPPQDGPSHSERQESPNVPSVQTTRGSPVAASKVIATVPSATRKSKARPKPNGKAPNLKENEPNKTSSEARAQVSKSDLAVPSAPGRGLDPTPGGHKYGNRTPSNTGLGSSDISMLPSSKPSGTDLVALMNQVPMAKTVTPKKKQRPSPKAHTTEAVQRSGGIAAKNQGLGLQSREKQSGQRLESKNMDTLFRNSAAVEVEFVRGEGKVITRHEPPTAPLKNAQLSKIRVPDQTFPIKYCWSKTRKIITKRLKWKADKDAFEIRLDDDEKVVIHAEGISSISYNKENDKFYLLPKASTAVEKSIEQLVLKVGSHETMYKLRTVLEQRFGALKVNQEQSNFFASKELEFEQANLFRLPSRTISQAEVPYENLSDGLDESTVEQLNSLGAKPAATRIACQNRHPVNEAVESNLESLVSIVGTRDLSPDVMCVGVSLDKIRLMKSKSLEARKRPTESVHASLRERFGGLGRPDLSEKPAHIVGASSDPVGTQTPVLDPISHVAKAGYASIKGAERRGLEIRSQVMQAVLVDRVIEPVSVKIVSPIIQPSSENTKATGSTAGVAFRDTLDASGLFFRSGEGVRVNDLVVRIRDMDTMRDAKNKFDGIDIYDGPFRIEGLPDDVALGSSTHRTEQGRSNILGKDEIELMREKKVKLHFPEGSKADPWVKLGRLRPVFNVYLATPEDLNARDCYYWPKGNGLERTIMNTEHSEEGCEDKELGTRGVCHLQKGTYIKVQYVSTEGIAVKSYFEVEKLRGKTVERVARTEYPDERMDDPCIVQYLEDGGVVLKSEILVVRYLVHWAGWPSEDDTYERAQDNIPQEFIDDFEESVGGYAEIPEPVRKRQAEAPGSAPKRRRSDAKRFVSMP